MRMLRDIWNDQYIRPYLYMVGIAAVAMTICYAIVFYLALEVAHEVETNGLKSVVDRIWEGPVRP